MPHSLSASDAVSADAGAPEPPRDEQGLETIASSQALGPYPVTQTTITLIDPSRTTPGFGDEPDSDQRELTSEVWFPDGIDGPVPLVVHGHGFLSSRLDSHGLATLLASHGAVVVAPDFPMTRRGLPGAPVIMDVLEQGADIVFIVKALREKGERAAPSWTSLIDPERWFATGVSLGAYSALVAGRGDWPDTSPPMGIVAMAPASCFLKPSDLIGDTPLLILHGSADAILPIEAHAEPLFQALDGPAWMVTLEGGTHTGCVDATAVLFEDLTHADVLGCDALDGRVGQPDELLARLGNPEARLSPCPAPCGDGSTDMAAMTTTRQIELMYAAVMAFWRLTVEGEDSDRDFLEQVMPGEATDLSVSVKSR